MKQFVACVNQPEELIAPLQEAHAYAQTHHPRSMLARVFCNTTQPDAVFDITSVLHREFPDLPFIGALTSRSIANGVFSDTDILLVIWAFDTSYVEVITCDCSGSNETSQARETRAWIDGFEDARAFELMMTVGPDMRFERFTNPLGACRNNIEVFGMASAIDGNSKTFVFTREGIVKCGAIGALYCGDDLFFDIDYAFGWRPLGKEFTVTKVEGNILEELDGIPALEIYKRYLKLENDNNFTANTVEFPLISDEHGRYIGRSAVGCRDDGALYLVADVAQGSHLRLGYGDPEALERSDIDRLNALIPFDADAICIYPCFARNTYLTENVEREIASVEKLAPSSGALCWGEIIRIDGRIRLLNVSTITAAVREGAGTHRKIAPFGEKDHSDKIAVPIIERLVRLIQVTTDELEQANRKLAAAADGLRESNVELKRTSIIDGFTGLLNRSAIEDEIDSRFARGVKPLSLIMIDVDHFKQVNDLHGHAAGDAVLQSAARLLQNSLQLTDVAGRWGGDEFMVLLSCEIVEATVFAKKLVKEMRDIDCDGVRATLSIGVGEARENEDASTLYRRVDHALYAAKNLGRNQVVQAQ